MNRKQFLRNGGFFASMAAVVSLVTKSEPGPQVIEGDLMVNGNIKVTGDLQSHTSKLDG